MFDILVGTLNYRLAGCRVTRPKTKTKIRTYLVKYEARRNCIYNCRSYIMDAGHLLLGFTNQFVLSPTKIHVLT